MTTFGTLVKSMSFVTKVPLSALPLPPHSFVLTKILIPDPHTSSPSEFRKLQLEKPSQQRRARILAPESHFSYVAPFPVPFPFRIEPKEGEEVIDKAALIERWLTEREAVHERTESTIHLKKYYPENRDQHLELVGLSETGLQDCVPHLHIGDAFDVLGSPTLSRSFEDEPDRPESRNEDVAARQELIEILSGHATLMNITEDPEKSWAPWSLRYSGHQFGVWAGQLGDGRAISVLATPHPSNPETVYELQLKGAGRTPFSRSADGLAVVRSSIREFLGAEAMHSLGIPTTRSLSLVSLPALPVLRERVESACVLTRVAPSFIRIGSFEALNPPEKMFFFGGGQQDAHWDSLRVLGEWVGQRVLKLQKIKWRDEANDEGDAWGRELVLEVARRNARMVAGWQAYGFMHGVINTDNVSIMGLTIDYGPYAFMDVFDPYHICNHSDEEGRYAYNAQPSMIIFAVRALLNALAPIIGAEAEQGTALKAGWADDATPEKVDEWRKEGLKLLPEVEETIQDTCADEYKKRIHKRLALRRIDLDDESKLARPLLEFMAEHRLDFHSTFRRLAYFRLSMAETSQGTESNKELDQYIQSVLTLTPEPQMVDQMKASTDLKAWLERYAARIKSEREQWGDDIDAEREKASRAVNPRFVLRQWVLEEVIKKVEQDADSGKRVLRKVLQMACNPFDPWGAEDDPSPEESLDGEVKEERRYCGIGEKKMLGFQCSCSS